MAREEEINNAKTHFMKEYLKNILIMIQEIALKKAQCGQIRIREHLGQMSMTLCQMMKLNYI